MLAIAVELLTGRYAATTFNRWDEAEWPPHPARLYSALVAVAADDHFGEGERAALRWLEAQPPPVLTCSDESALTIRAPVTVFVPVNDPIALKSDQAKSYHRMVDAEQVLVAASTTGDDRATARATRAMDKARAKSADDARKAGTASGTESASIAARALQVLPDRRSKQARSFPTVTPDADIVWFVWPDAEPSSDVVQVLDRLCGRIGRLGHTSSLVSCRVVEAEVPEPTLVPTATGPITLRVPQTGSLDRLEEAFLVHDGVAQRTLPAGTAFYAPAGMVEADPPSPMLGGDWIVLALPGRTEGEDGTVVDLPRIDVTRSLDLARAVRGALLRHGIQPAPEILSGHRDRRQGEDRSPATDRAHVAVVPLPDVAHRHSDARVHGVALVLPTDVGGEDRAAVEFALLAWGGANGYEVRLGGANGLRTRLDGPHLQRAPGSTGVAVEGWRSERDGRATVDRRFWCRPSRRWVTATPIALDRFPGDLTAASGEVRAKAEARATATVARACVLAGLPEPIDVEIDVSGFLATTPAAGGRGRGRRFPVFKAGGSGQARMAVHAVVTFDDPVSGPVLLGAGRFLGYGLCLPRDERIGGRS